MRHNARDIHRLRGVQKRLTAVLVVIAVIALVFTATSVTLFAMRHGVHPGIAWLLDPMVALALGAVLITDGVLAEYSIKPRGWSTALRYFAGLVTWVMNCWSSVWPPGTAFGVPHHVDAAGLVLHSIPPVLLIVLAEAVTAYRRAILAKVTELEADDTPPTEPAAPATVPVAVAERVRVPEVYPRPPEAVPAGVRLLPIVARPAAAPGPEVPAGGKRPRAAVLAAAAPRTRVEARVPEPSETTESAGEDPLTDQARDDFPEYLAAGQLPPFRVLRTKYRINQDRARRIRDELTKEPVR
ncbi:hypothetical protein ACL02R_09355 [Streptomyces sp. MS19]|uniref:hypothetical protein n=1 Tax=Streptomyces sp. MS19 TaxID=3385972 RepID=UPI0039A324E3